MDLRKLRHAVVLAQHLNFTRAASALNLTQSALSRSIQALEDECQLRLFDRNRNAVAVTAAGKEFLRHARTVLRNEAELVEMVRHAARGDGGNVALGMAPLAARMLMPPIMSEMIARSRFRAEVTIGTPRKLLAMLTEEELHLCVCTGRDMSPHALLASVPLARFTIAAIVRTGHPLAQRKAVTRGELDDYPHLRTSSFDLGGGDEAGTTGEMPDKTPALVIEDYDVLMRVAAATDAVWVTSPLSASEGIASGALTALPISWPSQAPLARMTAYHLKNRTLSPTARRILDRLVALSKDLIDTPHSGGTQPSSMA